MRFFLKGIRRKSGKYLIEIRFRTKNPFSRPAVRWSNQTRQGVKDARRSGRGCGSIDCRIFHGVTHSVQPCGISTDTDFRVDHRQQGLHRKTLRCVVLYISAMRLWVTVGQFCDHAAEQKRAKNGPSSPMTTGEGGISRVITARAAAI